jgi:hypothetical protein
MDFEPIKRAWLAGNISPISSMTVYLSQWNPIIVTHSDGKAVKDIDEFRIEMFPGLA